MTKYIQINICLYNITECISFYLYTLKCVIHVHNFWNWINVWPIQLSYIVGTCTPCFSRSSSFFSSSQSVYHYLLLFPRTILFMLWCHHIRYIHVVFIYSACCPTLLMYALVVSVNMCSDFLVKVDIYQHEGSVVIKFYYYIW